MIDQSMLLGFLEDELGIETEEIGPDTELFSSGLVDSFALVTLMMQIEKVGRFRINPGEVTLENFDTINRILAFVRRAAA